MKILFTTSTYYPLSDGVQNITAFYAEKLASEGHEVTVVTSKYEDLKEDDEHNGVWIKRVNVFTKKSIYYGEINEYKYFMLNMSKGVDVIINVCLQTALTDCLLDIVQLFECKTILYLHGMAHFHFPYVPKVDLQDIMSWTLNVIRWKSFYNRAFDKISAYDQIIHLHEKDETYKKCIDNGILKNSIIENGTCMATENHLQSSDSDYYLCVSNYFHDKNQELVLEAYYKSETEKKLLLIGSTKTKYYEKLVGMNKKYKKIARTKNKEVIFLLNQPREITEKYINNAFGLLTGSKSEKYPVIICEAIAAGIPYISTDIGIIKYLPGGIIVQDSVEMAVNINYLESGNFDRKQNTEREREYRKEKQNMNTNYLKLLSIIENC